MWRLRQICRIKEKIDWKKLRGRLFFIVLYVLLCILAWVSGKNFVEQNKSNITTVVPEATEKQIPRIYEEIKVSRLVLNNKTAELHEGEEFTLTTEVSGDETTAKFISDNPDVVEVSKSGIIKAIACGQANVLVEANGLIKKCVVSVVPIEKTPVISENTKQNISKQIHAKYISLKKPEFTAPISDVYGEYLQYATDLYNALVNRENFYFAFDFITREEALLFRDMVNQNMLPTGVCLYESVAHGYDRMEDGTFVEYHRMIYDKSWIDSKNVDIYTALEAPYIACVSAGLSNQLTETESVRKIVNWISSHMTYEHNNGDAYVGFVTGRGQCHTYAEMFRAMCNVANIKCEYIRGNAEGNHAWNKVFADGNWYFVDSTWYDSTGNNKYILASNLWNSHTITEQ